MRIIKIPMQKRLMIISLLIVILIIGVEATPASAASQNINPPSVLYNSEPADEANIILTIEIAIGLLLTASLVGIITERGRKFSYTINKKR